MVLEPEPAAETAPASPSSPAGAMQLVVGCAYTYNPVPHPDKGHIFNRLREDMRATPVVHVVAAFYDTQGNSMITGRHISDKFRCLITGTGRLGQLLVNRLLNERRSR